MTDSGRAIDFALAGVSTVSLFMIGYRMMELIAVLEQIAEVLAP